MESTIDYSKENEVFFEKVDSCFRELFDAAKDKHELHFAMALMPEMRGMQDAGWNTVHETQALFHEYMEFLENSKPGRMTSRITLGFYCHLSEASGFYEVPKNMLRISEGKTHLLWPFMDLVQEHRQTGNKIAPNANKVLRDLSGHASTLGFNELSEVFRDAFDPDLRNGYAHADYIVWEDGIRLPKRNGGYASCVPWEKFHFLFERGINFFYILQGIVTEYIKLYVEPKTIVTSLQDEPATEWTIYADPDKGTLGITSGSNVPAKT